MDADLKMPLQHGLFSLSRTCTGGAFSHVELSQRVKELLRSWAEAGWGVCGNPI